MHEYTSRVESQCNEVNVLGLNIRSLGFHHDQLKKVLETFECKPEILIITETWLTENDSLERFELDDYQPVESKPRECFKRRSGGVAVYVKEGIRYRSIELQTQKECSIMQVIFSDSDVKNFCAVYRPETFRLSKFFPEFEVLLHFLKTLKGEKTIFGDFNIDTLNEHKDKTDYTSLLASYDFQVQNCLPTRVTPTSKTCLDHLITERTVNTETIQTTISDHFTVTAKIPAIWKESKSTKILLARTLNRLKGENALNFLFLLDQKL